MKPKKRTPRDKVVHAISSPVFKAIMRGFRDGAARLPMRLHEWPDTTPEHHGYSMGYSDGQHAGRVYSDRTCRRIGLENPTVHATGRRLLFGGGGHEEAKRRWIAYADERVNTGMVPTSELMPVQNLLTVLHTVVTHPGYKKAMIEEQARLDAIVKKAEDAANATLQ